MDGLSSGGSEQLWWDKLASERASKCHFIPGIPQHGVALALVGRPLCQVFTHHGGHLELTCPRWPFSLQGRCYFLCPDPPAAEANGWREAHGDPGGTGSLKHTSLGQLLLDADMLVKIQKATLPFPLPASLSVTPQFPWTLQQLEISGAGVGCALFSHQQPDLSVLATLSSSTHNQVSHSPPIFILFYFSAEVLALWVLLYKPG